MVKELKNVKVHIFDAQAFLDSEGSGRKIAKFRIKETVFAQGDPANNVMYIREGCAKLRLTPEARSLTFAILLV